MYKLLISTYLHTSNGCSVSSVAVDFETSQLAEDAVQQILKFSNSTSQWYKVARLYSA